jgi:hypothetical protein
MKLISRLPNKNAPLGLPPLGGGGGDRSLRLLLWQSLTMQGIKHKLRGEKSYTKELRTSASPSPNLKNSRRCFRQF